MRLIDADKAKEKLRGNAQKDGNPFVGAIVEMFCEFLDQAPTVENVPASVTPVHGEWILKHVGRGHYWECSVCHTNPCIYVTNDTKFCPNCGAKMDEEEKHDPKG